MNPDKKPPKMPIEDATQQVSREVAFSFTMPMSEEKAQYWIDKFAYYLEARGAISIKAKIDGIDKKPTE